ncbi:unnamed protein product [Phytomonas sp. EM1]|nr:unnamed protein product [Phytomonas sp. EM1]|eukprot:CCW59724.1 unnamed protein product [Phytomonas sp. isolate EM1]
MTTIEAPSAVAMEKLEGFSKELNNIEDEREKKAEEIRLSYRLKMEPLLEKRHQTLSTLEGFWSGVFSSPETALNTLINSTIDPKIIRTIIDFKVVSTVKENKLIRKVCLVLRGSIFAEGGTISHEIDTDMNTVSIQPIHWKEGTDRARKDSLFRFFEENSTADSIFHSDALEAFDNVFQNPFLAVEAD